MARPVYARIQDLRDAGLTDSVKFDDDRLLDMLELAAEVVEAVTLQFFGPRRLTLTLDGWGRRAVGEEARNKIIEVENLFAKDQLGGRSIIDPAVYAVHDRLVRLRTYDSEPEVIDRAFAAWPMRRFRFDDKNVELVAVFGWLDLAERFETTLAAPLAKGALTASLTTTGEIEKNDLLLVDGKFWVIVGAVPTPASPPIPGTVSFDPSPWKAAAGAKVVRYGKVPRLVREAVVRTALANQYGIGSEEELAAESAGRIKREETDDYLIEFFQGPGRVAAASSGTGDPRADAILSRFRAPAVSGMWV